MLLLTTGAEPEATGSCARAKVGQSRTKKATIQLVFIFMPSGRTGANMEMHVLDQSPYCVYGSLCASPNKSAAFCTFQELKKYNIGNRYRYCFDKGESFRWEALEAEKLPTRSQAKQAAI